MFELYEDIRPWQYYVDECGMKQESLDLMKRSIEFVFAHYTVSAGSNLVHA